MKPGLVVALVLCACRSEAEPPVQKVVPKVALAAPPKVTDITAQDYVMPALPHARVTLKDAFGGKHAVDAEVAATRDSRTRGLMWRTSLTDGQGMLFIFHGEQRLSFWMKNTLIPLDMIFLAKDLSIVGIVENAEPRTLSARGPGSTPSQYVLEVPGGWSAKVGLRAGLKVELEGTKAIEPQDD